MTGQKTRAFGDNMAVSMHDPTDQLAYCFMFDLVCNEHRYTPQAGHKVLDLGAHYGFFSLYCASRGANVVAYEPDPDNFARLEDAAGRAREIGFGSITPIQKAIWIRESHQVLYREHHNGTSNITQNGHSLNNYIQTVSLDDALQDKEWDCAKMDIEAAEFEVLDAATKLNQIKYLSLELHNHIGQNPQSRYENLISKLERFFTLDLVEQRDGRFCKVFGTRK